MFSGHSPGHSVMSLFQPTGDFDTQLIVSRDRPHNFRFTVRYQAKAAATAALLASVQLSISHQLKAKSESK
jgi:hypothetical protein